MVRRTEKPVARTSESRPKSLVSPPAVGRNSPVGGMDIAEAGIRHHEATSGNSISLYTRRKRL